MTTGKDAFPLNMGLVRCAALRCDSLRSGALGRAVVVAHQGADHKSARVLGNGLVQSAALR